MSIYKNKLSPLRNSFLCVLLILFSMTSWSADRPLRVGVAPGEPFIIIKNNEYQGISIDVWKLIASNLNITYQLIPMSEHIDDNIRQLAKGEIDILIGPIIPTLDRIKLVDFTNPYYLNQIKVVVPIKNISFSQIFSAIKNSAISSVVFFLIIFFIIYIHVFWFFEGRKGYMDVKPSYFSGILTAFWIHTLGISFGKLPTHAYTRTFRLIWAIVTVLLLSTVTATITSSLTIALSNNFGKGNTLNDFQYELLAAVVGTAPFDIAKAAEMDIKPVNSRIEAMNLVLKGNVAGYIDYAPIADYYIREHSLITKLALANAVIQQNTFAIALPLNSPLRHPINTQLSILQSLGEVHFICKKFLSEQTAQNCNI